MAQANSRWVACDSHRGRGFVMADDLMSSLTVRSFLNLTDLDLN